ncbi:GFA family protein [Pelagivirga sediminicola]|uniref:GFA family protein n=1 Tax=Pelagivirga sediminicola TaxID=2170575 RepID=A0A2T7G827_9RHOB|nr:GFA family protein [Pelagivirga sediminicola]PVA10564.1 GFA family protein [Pelagivirga sediminicola]
MSADDVCRGQCLCGAVRIELRGAHDTGVAVCHCYRCQRWSGGLYATFNAPAAGVTVIGDVARYAAPPLAERAFCPVCGSNLWLRDHTEGAQYELIAGIFPGASGFPLKSEIYVDQAPSYAPLRGDHPRQTAAEYEATNPSVEGDAP